MGTGGTQTVKRSEKHQYKKVRQNLPKTNFFCVAILHPLLVKVFKSETFSFYYFSPRIPNLSKNLTFQCKTYKNRHFFISLAQFYKILKNLKGFFSAVFLPNSEQNFMKVNSDSAKKSLLEGLHLQIGRASIQV